MRRFYKHPNSVGEDTVVPQEFPPTRGDGRDVSHIPDFPDPGVEDVDAPEDIPPTYHG
jgi:hypothetical protein